MSMSWGCYSDPGLSTTLTELAAALVRNGPARDFSFSFGSVSPNKRLQAAATPGVDQIMISVADSAAGSGMAASAIKLALSQAGLDVAVGGAALALGASLLSGVNNARTIWLRIDPGVVAAGSYTDLSLATNDVIESAV